MRPNWTVTSYVRSPENPTWLGTSWEFFTNEIDAAICYQRHLNTKTAIIKRPYNDRVDWSHRVFGAPQSSPKAQRTRAEKAAAIAKLTPYERKLLGLDKKPK